MYFIKVIYFLQFQQIILKCDNFLSVSISSVTISPQVFLQIL